MRDYRRGVLLGLSLAEVFILLLFCFLLLIAPRIVPQSDEGKDEDAPPPLTADQKTDQKASTDVPLTLDSMPLTPGLHEENPTPLPLVEAPSQSSASTNEQTGYDEPEDVEPQPQTSVSTNENGQDGSGSNTIVMVDGMASKESEGEGAQGDRPSTGNSESPPDETSPVSDDHGDSAQQPSKGEHNWPPIIPLDEAAGYSFPTGSAELSESFADKLRSEIRQKILEYLQDYQADVVEVVGHTDERPVNGVSNLDGSLVQVFSGEVPAARLSAADNVGLGMARAAAVAQVLRSCIEWKDIKIIPYSGGQVVERGDLLATGENSGDRSERRRIEIRVRRSTEAVE